MSKYSTLRITRKKAIEVMIEKLLGDISDDELEAFMDCVLEPQLYNARIVDDSHSDNDDDCV